MWVLLAHHAHAPAHVRDGSRLREAEHGRRVRGRWRVPVSRIGLLQQGRPRECCPPVYYPRPPVRPPATPNNTAASACVNSPATRPRPSSWLTHGKPSSPTTSRQLWCSTTPRTRSTPSSGQRASPRVSCSSEAPTFSRPCHSPASGRSRTSTTSSAHTGFS